MIFKTVVFAWGSTLIRVEDQRALSYVSVGTDVHVLYGVINAFVWKAKKSVALVHQNPIAPVTLQTILLLAGIITLFVDPV